MTYQELLKEASLKIEEAELETNVAKLLLIHYTKENIANIYANLDKEVDEKTVSLFNEGLNKYVNEHIPLQYITGEQAFFGYDFKVNENVLIPRRETEELVERVIYYIEDNYEGKSLDILDIGTGSGCIAVTLDKELQDVNITAVDISEKALLVAQKNNDLLKANVTFKLGDLYGPVKDKKFDVIVSNPPYIVNKGIIGKTVKHEPEVSLYGGDDGLDFYRKIIKESKKHIKKGGLIAFEHAYDTAKELKQIALSHYEDANVILYQDLSGYDRITFIEVGDFNV